MRKIVLEIARVIQLSTCLIFLTTYIPTSNCTNNHTLSVNYGEDVLLCKNGRKLTRSLCLQNNYQATDTPNPDDRFITVYTDIIIKGIREVNDKKRIMVIDVKIVFIWHDSRIVHEATEKEKEDGEIKLGRRQIEEIWKPEIYIYNLSKFEVLKISNPINRVSVILNKSLSHENNTMIRYVLEGTASIYCKFDLHNYPMDDQTCQLQISSDIGNVDFVLKSKEILLGDGSGDFETDIGFYNDYLIGDCYKRVVGVNLKMNRFMQPFLMKYYLPSVSIVIVSGISFIVPLNSLPARVALLVTQFLTLTNIFIHQQVYVIDVFFKMVS